MAKKQTTRSAAKKLQPASVQAPAESNLLPDLRELILNTRQSVARGVNTALVQLYWQIGHRIHKDILASQRAEYGKQTVSKLGQALSLEFGRGFTKRNLDNMIRFAEVFPDAQIVHAMSAQLNWTHLRQIIYLKEPLQREFYAEMCRE